MNKTLIRKAVFANSLLWKGSFLDELVFTPDFLIWFTENLDTLFMSSAQELTINAEFEENIKVMEAYLSARGKQTSIYVDSNSDTTLVSHLLEHGYQEDTESEEVWWVLDLDKFDPSEVKLTEGLSIKKCTDVEIFGDHIQAALLGYGDFEDWAIQLKKNFQKQIDGIEINHYVGYMNDKPASCSTVGHYFDISILINTAVVPEFRRRGIHTSMMATRLIEAKEKGSKYAFYQTEPTNEASISTGQKLGFVEGFRRKLYVKK